MAKQELLGNIELPFLKILFNNGLFSDLEIGEMDNFLLDIGFNESDLLIYKKLQQIDITGISEKEIDIFYQKIITIFYDNKYNILSIIGKNNSFKSLKEKLEKKLSVNNTRLLDIISEYIRIGLLTLITNYQTSRIAKGIFNIIKE